MVLKCFTLKKTLTHCSLATNSKPEGRDNLAIQLDTQDKSVLFGGNADLALMDDCCCFSVIKCVPTLSDRTVVKLIPAPTSRFLLAVYVKSLVAVISLTWLPQQCPIYVIANPHR